MEKKNSSYRQIIQSTSIFGGSQVITTIIGVIRVKIIALLLGVVGVGLLGIYQSVIDTIRTTTSLGIDTSGVKEIANASNKHDELHQKIAILNRWFVATGLLGMLLSIILAYPISLWVFGNASFALSIACLSVAVFLTTVTIGKSVVMQGMRKVSYIAKATVWSSFIGLIVAIPMLSIFGQRSIVFILISSSLVFYFTTNYYYRKLDIQLTNVSNSLAFKGGLGMLKLGIYILLAGIVNTLSMLLIRTFITHDLGVDSVGIFQATWTITNVYLGLVLKSMSTDYYPRLSEIVDDLTKMKKLVNEQTYVGLIIASPIIIGMLLFSDIALSLLYSSEFIEGNALLRWQILGTFLKLLSWPISFILLVKNRGILFLCSELLFYGIYLLFSYILQPIYGLDAVGVGYLIAYIVYLPFILLVCHSIAKFRWSGHILTTIFVYTIFIIVAFLITVYQSDYTYILGIPILIFSILYSYFKLRKIITIRLFKKRC